MFIILTHVYTNNRASIQVAKRDNFNAPLYATKAAAQNQADRWNRKMRNIGLIQNRYYHVYPIGGNK